MINIGAFKNLVVKNTSGVSCKDCVYADISDSPRMVDMGNTKVYQSNTGSIVCTKPNLKSITINMSGSTTIKCDNFKSRKEYNK